MTIARSSLLGVLVWLALGAGSVRACLAFEPAEIQLQGVLEKRLLPGPPNYESIAAGDRPEGVLILILSESICVKGDADSVINGADQAGIREIQISWPEGNLSSLIGKRVRMYGTLSTAVTGHHRTPVWLRVTRTDGPLE